MFIIIKIAFRNLIRKKIRNGILVVAIVASITALFIMNGFSAGISHLILNNFIGQMMGHVEISVLEKTKKRISIIRDKNDFIARITNALATPKELQNSLKNIEGNLSAWSQGIGSGKSDNFILTGLPKDKLKQNIAKNEVSSSLKAINGSLKNFVEEDNTALIYSTKAKLLNLNVGDYINVRLTTISGQREAAKYKIAGVLKSANMFTDMTLFIGSSDFKKVVGYKQHESASLKIVLNYPRQAEVVAKALRASFYPKLAYLPLQYKGQPLLALTPNEKKLIYVREEVQGSKNSTVNSTIPSFFSTPLKKNELIVNDAWLRQNKVFHNQNLTLQYKSKYDGIVNVAVIIKSLKRTKVNPEALAILNLPQKNDLSKRIAFLAPATFYSNYYRSIPQATNFTEMDSQDFTFFTQIDKSQKPEVRDSFVRQWILFEPSASANDITVKLSSLNKVKWQGQALDVRTMYATGSQILQLEQAINFLSLPALLVMTGIILIGVINTLNLSIRERTREIGTMRAIGISKMQVLWIFITESMMLATIAAIVGIVIAISVMALISSINIETDSSLSLFLNQGHLYFKNSLLSFFTTAFFTILVTSFTAYFPARKASNLKPSAALMHYD